MLIEVYWKQRVVYSKQSSHVCVVISIIYWRALLMGVINHSERKQTRTDN